MMETQWYIIEPNNTWSLWVMGPPAYVGQQLEKLQAVVGGYIEYLPSRFLGRHVEEVIVNEDGIAEGLPRNLLAEAVFKQEYQFSGDCLRGTVIVHAHVDFGKEMDRLKNHLAMFYEITNRTKSDEI